MVELMTAAQAAGCSARAPALAGSTAGDPDRTYVPRTGRRPRVAGER